MALSRDTSRDGAFRVVIAGGGVAGLESLIALRALARDRLAIELVAPTDEFVYRPLSVLDPFAGGAVRRYSLPEIAADLGAGFRHDTLAGVRGEERVVVTEGGAELAYDALVVATGARRLPAYERTLTFRGEQDAEAAHGLIQDLEAGYTRRLGFVVPGGVTWTLPLYELALMTAARAYDVYASEVALTLITPEAAPLEVFGPAVSSAVASLLAAAGIAFQSATVKRVEAGRTVILEGRDGPPEFDHVIALPRLAGPRIAGLPADAEGFLPVNSHARVQGLERVLAAGDGTSQPIKQGGLAAQQADAAAEMIAAQAGAPLRPRPFEPVLRAILLTGSKPRYLRRALSGADPPFGEISEQPLWVPPSKIAGAYLAPYLDARDAHSEAAEPAGVERRLAAHPAPGVRRRAILAPSPRSEARFDLLPIDGLTCASGIGRVTHTETYGCVSEKSGSTMFHTRSGEALGACCVALARRGRPGAMKLPNTTRMELWLHDHA